MDLRRMCDGVVMYLRWISRRGVNPPQHCFDNRRRRGGLTPPEPPPPGVNPPRAAAAAAGGVALNEELYKGDHRT